MQVCFSSLLPSAHRSSSPFYSPLPLLRHALPPPPRPLGRTCRCAAQRGGRTDPQHRCSGPPLLNRHAKCRRKTTNDVRRSPPDEKGRGRNTEAVHRSRLPLHSRKPAFFAAASLLNTSRRSPSDMSSTPTTPTSTKAAPSRNSPYRSVVKVVEAVSQARSSPVTEVVDTSAESVSSISTVALPASTMLSESSMTREDLPTSPSSRNEVPLLP